MRVALGVVAGVCAAVAATLLWSSQPASTRHQHLDITAAQIRQGNYYAWGQVWMWLEKLSPDEKRALFAACAQYASSNRVLHVKGCEWPPDHSTGDFPTTVFVIRTVAGMRNDALVYDRLLRPPADVMVSKFEAMYTAPVNIAP